MRILDKYIIKKFLGTFFFSLLLIISIIIIFDISEKIDDFIENKAPLKAIIFHYYLNFIPYFVNLFSPLFTFIAVIFFTAKMATDTEIVAILSGGVSFKRLLFPYFISAAILASLSYVLGSWVIPPANKVRLEFEENYIRNRFHFTARNIHRQIKPGKFIYLESYDNNSQTGYKFSYEEMEQGKLKYKLMSDFIRWDSTKNKWQVNNFFIRRIDNMKESIRTGNVIDSTFGFTAAEFNQRVTYIEMLNDRELDNFIGYERLKGSENLNYYLVEKYRRISFPFATFILTLIGVSLASRKVRGGIGLQIGFGLLLSFSYILFLQVSTTFAINSSFSPLLGVWIPNIIYAIIGIVLMRNAPK